VLPVQVVNKGELQTFYWDHTLPLSQAITHDGTIIGIERTDGKPLDFSKSLSELDDGTIFRAVLKHEEASASDSASDASEDEFEPKDEEERCTYLEIILDIIMSSVCNHFVRREKRF
jgi:hypothetical protein